MGQGVTVPEDGKLVSDDVTPTHGGRPRSLVVLTGGGTRGCFQVAPIERIHRETRIGAVVGASIGAENGYGVATRQVEAIRPFWLEIKRGEFFQRRTLNPLDGLYTLNPLFKRIEEKRWGLPQIPFYVGVFNWTLGRHELVRLNHRPLADVLDLMRASSSIVGIHDVLKFGDHYLGDGGHDTPLPVPGRWWAEYDEVHVISCRPLDPIPPVDNEKVDDVLGQLARWGDHVTAVRLRHSWRRLKRMARRREDIPIYFYAPKDWSHVHPTFPKKDRDLREAIARGLEHGEWMADHRVQL